MKHLLIIALLAVSSFAIAGGSHSGGHGHDEPKSSSHANSGSHGHGGGHGHQGEGHTQSAVGIPVDSQRATKTIKVELLDSMRFKFSEEVNLKNGDVVKFVVTNKGRLPHEFSIGNKKEQDAHREMMRNMHNGHGEGGNSVSLKSGETKELVWQFTGNQDVIFACNIPGHYESGMHSSAKIRG